ncbi:MAG: helix-turn-helix transcriptional regulator [Pseudotabrizicola sp.]|nr:helix-turn-helix transcriptional regulator [Pseudotabrizicola sp.]MDZ7574736.1 helix-turn-helix transcriptional regulator [Pseudotabrizicola sp.]
MALPNLAETQLAEAIRLNGHPGFEQALASFLRATCAPDNLIILAYRSAGPPLVLYRQTDHPQVFSELNRTYLAGAYRLDPFYDLHLRRASAGAYRIQDIAPDAFQRSRYFIEYYDQTTLVDEITFVAYPSPWVTLNICVGRDASSGKVFSMREVETCTRIAPIVQALSEVHWASVARSTGPAEDTSALLAAAARSRLGIHLSPRQAEVALLILRGHSTVSIGLRLGVSAQTVKVFRKQLYSRCQISSQAELFALMLPLLKDGADITQSA